MPDVQPKAQVNSYRERWTWDSVKWGSHAVDCYPCWGSCPIRVYVKDGKVAREEQSGTLLAREPGTPDPNPLGCQVGCGWSRTLDGQERVLYPLKRLGERGSGSWERVGWDQALTGIADGLLGALQEAGPESVVDLAGGNALNAIAATARSQFMRLIGGVTTDVDAEVSDFSPGAWLTYGKLPDHGWDDDFHSQLIVIWNMNPLYTRVPVYHYISEARYHGAEVVIIAPDYSPSAMHTDYFVPVKPGGDPALLLGMCNVVVTEGFVDEAFVREQTDLPLLVRLDTRQFLREADLRAAGRSDQFYWWDEAGGGLAAAPRGTLASGESVPALRGHYAATLPDGSEVDVAPAFQLLLDRLDDYTPEKAASLCGVGPELIRLLARKVATRRTRVHEGRGGGKHYHSDLMERSMLLLLGLTGNWGKKGAGMETWSIVGGTGSAVFAGKERAGAEETERILGGREQAIAALRREDPTRSYELAAVELARLGSALGPTVPPAFFWYWHAGFSESWDRQEWSDPSMRRPFRDYFDEAARGGSWGALASPVEAQEPRVLLQFGGNVLRRTRGAGVLRRHLWPKLKFIITLDFRMSTTALHSDYVLPVANHHEKLGFGLGDPELLMFNLLDKATEPAGESKNEWEIFGLLLRRIEERAAARGFSGYTDSRGGSYRLDNLWSRYTKDGAFQDEEKIADEMIRDTALAGTIDSSTTLESMRRDGMVSYTDWGLSPMGISQASDIKADEAHSPLRHHTEQLLPYPTLTRRAEFYIDHEWFIEAGEELPVHKDPPPMGGDYPLRMTSGHNRWSIHSTNIANELMLATHRGTPQLVMSPADAAARGLSDGDQARVHNDMGAFVVPLKLSGGVQPGQVVCYNGWEPYQFPGWHGPNEVETNTVKWLHFAHGYGHLRYYAMGWQPAPADRCTRVEVAAISAAS